MGSLALRLALSAGLVFGGLFALIVVGTRLHREWVAARDVSAPPPVSLQVDAGPAPASADDEIARLRVFLGIAPASRLDAALADADTRFLGVGAAALQVPGVADVEHRFEAARILAIPGATATPTTLEHAALVERARRYARAYNVLLVRRTAPSELSSSAAARSPERTAPSGVGASR